jgi:hypothetical protein
LPKAEKFDAGSTGCNKMTHFVTESPDATNELVTFPILKIRRDPKRSG